MVVVVVVVALVVVTVFVPIRLVEVVVVVLVVFVFLLALVVATVRGWRNPYKGATAGVYRTPETTVVVTVVVVGTSS